MAIDRENQAAASLCARFRRLPSGGAGGLGRLRLRPRPRYGPIYLISPFLYNHIELYVTRQKENIDRTYLSPFAGGAFWPPPEDFFLPLYWAWSFYFEISFAHSRL